MRLAIVHVGTHKTGTTALQRYLVSARERLAHAGLCYPLAGLEPGYVAHQVIGRAVLGVGPLEELIEQVVQEVDASGAPHLLLSSEVLESFDVHRAGWDLLVERLTAAGFEVHARIYLRRQHDYFLSLFKELSREPILMWRFDEALEAALRDGVLRAEFGPLVINYQFDYRSLVAALRSSLGPRAHVVPFAAAKGRSPDAVADFRSFLEELVGIESPQPLAVPSINPSRPLHTGLYGYARNRAMLAHERMTLRQLFREVDADLPAGMLTSESALKTAIAPLFQQRFAADNRAAGLGELYGMLDGADAQPEATLEKVSELEWNLDEAIARRWPPSDRERD